MTDSTFTKIENSGLNIFHENVFKIDGLQFVGYRVRVHVDYHRFYLLEDGSFQESASYHEKPKAKCKIFKEGDTIPVFPINRITACIAECVWKAL